MIVLLATLALAAAPARPALEAGAYRLDLTIATATRVPFAGETTVTTHSTALVDLRPGPGGGTATQQVCAVSVEDDLKMSDTLIPPAFVEAYPEQTWSFQLADDGTFAADPGSLALGWDPTRADEVPDDPDHPAVRDWEGDGHPGATVILQVPVFRRVEVYVAQRGHSTYRGTLGGDTVRGRVEVLVNEQRTLGASNLLFKGETSTRPVPERSTFSLAPVPPGTTCADLQPVQSPPSGVAGR